MEIYVKTEDENGNILFEGKLGPKEHEFVINVGINYLLANGATPFIKDEDDPGFPPSTDELQ